MNFFKLKKINNFFLKKSYWVEKIGAICGVVGIMIAIILGIIIFIDVFDQEGDFDSSLSDCVLCVRVCVCG